MSKSYQESINKRKCKSKEMKIFSITLVDNKINIRINQKYSNNYWKLNNKSKN